jgi:hypothetical protein
MNKVNRLARKIAKNYLEEIMNAKTKAGVTSTGLNLEFYNKNLKTNSVNNITRNRNFGQQLCPTCGSDYLKHSVDGICQFCLQLEEFIVREGLQVEGGLAR